MAWSSQVPEFGKWDGGENVPYTAYFDNATKAKSERLNRNDPSLQQKEIPATVKSNNEQQKIREGASELPGRDYESVKSAKSQGQQASRPKHVQEDLSLEDVNRRKNLDSPLHNHQRQGNITSNSSKRTLSNGTGSEGVWTEVKSAVPSSPLRDRRGLASSKGSSHEGIAPLTPGRSRQRSVPRGNEAPDHSAAVPKFGDWDESDPSSSENYSNIFNRVREERQAEDGSLPAGTNASRSNTRNHSSAEDSKRCCCFPWGK